MKTQKSLKKFNDEPYIPSIAFVEVNMDCKYGCSHCYQVAFGQKRNRKLTLEDAIVRINELKNLGVRRIIPVTGEVLFDTTYLKVFHEVGWDEYLLTSGAPALENKELAKEIKMDGFKGVRISAHYFPPDMLGNNSISPISEAQIPEIVKIMKDVGLYVDAYCILTTSNFNMINEILERAKSDGIDKILFMNFYPTKPEFMKFRISEEQVETVFSQIQKAQKTSDLKIDCFGNFGPPPWKPSHARLANMGKYCPAGVSKVYITVDGSFYPCHGILNEKFRMGSFENGQFKFTKNSLAGYHGKKCLAFQILDS